MLMMFIKLLNPKDKTIIPFYDWHLVTPTSNMDVPWNSSYSLSS